MHYVIYFLVTTPLLIAWLVLASATMEPSPLFPTHHQKYNIRISSVPDDNRRETSEIASINGTKPAQPHSVVAGR